VGIFKTDSARSRAPRSSCYHACIPSMKSPSGTSMSLTDYQGRRDPKVIVCPLKAVVDGSRFSVQVFSMAPARLYPPRAVILQGLLHVPSARRKAPLSRGLRLPVKVMADDPMAVAVSGRVEGSIAASGAIRGRRHAGDQNPTPQNQPTASELQYLADRPTIKRRPRWRQRPGRAAKMLSHLRTPGSSSERGFRDQEGRDPCRPLIRGL